MLIQPFKLERYFARHEFSAKHLLCSSDCESIAVADLLDMEAGSREQSEQLWLGYTESQGNPILRDEIARTYAQINAEQVLVMAGEEAIFVFMNTALAPGDHVIVHYPCYQSLFEIAKAIGCEVTMWTTAESEAWELDVDFLRRSIRSNTRAIVINSPHNPTGYLMNEGKLREIVAVAREKNLIVFSDESYRFLEYGSEDRSPAACDLDERCVSLGVTSKSFGLAGLRIGWLATQNADLLERMKLFKDYTTICSSAPSEFLAIIALKHRERLIARNLQIIQDNLSVLNEFFLRHSDRFRWTPPQAGPIAFPSLKGETNADEFCRDLLAKEDVLLLPGSVYGNWPKHFRIGFGRLNFPEALQRFDHYLNTQHSLVAG